MSKRAEPIFSRVAKLDIRDAARWYRRTASDDVSRQFLLAVEQCVALVPEHPQAFGKVYFEFRKVLVPGFPYSLFYVDLQKRVKDMAVMHWRRDERDWQIRAR